MANVDRPNGFRFAKSSLGVAPNAQMRRYLLADRSSDTTNNHGDIYVGDPVKLVSGKILAANSGDTILGVFEGYSKAGAIDHSETPGMFNPDDLSQRYAPLADTTGAGWVVPAEGNLFEVQTASDLDLLPGSAADISTDATESHGSQTTSRSSAELVTSTNADIRVVEDVTTPDNDATLANARHLVMFVTTTNTL